MKHLRTRVIVLCMLAALLVVPWQAVLAAPVGPVSPSALDGAAALKWNTFLGCSGIAGSGQVVSDADGNSYVVGFGYRTWGEPIRPFTGDNDVYVAKLSINGDLLWMTFLGGEGNDLASDIAIDDEGFIYVSGISLAEWSCLDAPCTIRSYSDDDPIFAAKLDPEGNLLWNTFLGGARGVSDEINGAITVHGSDSVYITGHSNHTWGAPLRNYTKQDDAFVARLDADGNLIWNTFLGGSSSDDGNDVATDSLGNVYVVGESNSGWSCDSTPPSCMIEPYSGYDAYVAKLGSDGSLLWNSFLGGTSGDSAYAIAVDDADRLFVAGTSEGPWGEPIRSYTEGSGQWTDEDAFVARMDAGGHLIWNTFLGSESYDEGFDIDFDRKGHLYVAGASGRDWGTSVSPTYDDAFAASLDLSGNLLWNIFLGAPEYDMAFGIASNKENHVVVTGFSERWWGSPLRPLHYAPNVFVAQLTLTYSTVWLPLAVMCKTCTSIMYQSDVIKEK